MMKLWIALWNIIKKDMKNYYLKPPNISWGIIFPLSWTLMFFLRSPEALTIKELLPGVMALSILFGTTSMLAVTITFEKRSRSFERLLLAPIPLHLLIVAKVGGAVFFGMANALVPLVLAAFFIDLNDVRWVFLATSIFLVAMNSTLLGLSIAVSVREVFEAQTFSNFFRFPMIFLCGLFLPLDHLPLIIRPLSYVLPLTYGADALRGSVGENMVFTSFLNILLLLGFAIALYYFSLGKAKKNWLL